MKYCMDCKGMNYKDRCGADAKCERKRRYYDPYSIACDDDFEENGIYRSELERRYNSTDTRINPDYSKTDEHSSSCYLTTTICECLNYEDDCNYLETLRNFRDNIMIKDEKYYDLLAEYDVVGPLISKSLIECEDRSNIALNLLINYIVPVYFKINNNRHKQAIKTYIDMVNNLKEMFGLGDISLTRKDNDYPKIKTKKDIHKLKACYNIKGV